ncbi:MAG TPA: BPSS1780 family membrane protein [Casimicrobiaceae bacterium]|nr:BPSS1780 family membrane protein [Casimicrobiaceae bacterium]
MSAPARATDIVFTRHTASRGIVWLKEAYAMFSRARMPWLVLISLYYLILLLASRIPLVGHVVVSLLKPVLAVGLLAAAWTHERGSRPAMGHLFKGFRSNLRALLMLGAVFFAGITAAVLATALFDGGVLLDLLSSEARPAADSTTSAKPADRPSPEELLKTGRLQLSMLLAVLFSMPTILGLWFAPALVVFQDAGPGAAIGASLRAALGNWRPLIVYGLAVMLVGAMLPVIVAQFVVMLLPSQATFTLVWILFFAYGLMFAVTLHIADYVSYRDVFHAGETLAPLTARSGDR